MGEEKPRVQVYTTRYCPFCDAAKRLLKERKIEFEEIDVTDPEKKVALKEKTGWKTVPQIFMDGELIGGYQELVELDRKGELFRSP